MISSINCHRSKISEDVDYYLQRIVRVSPSYIKDKTDFLRKLKPIAEVPENSYLVTLDVESLYTSIPNSEGIKVVKIPHVNFTKKAIATKVITVFLALILTLNNLYYTQNTFFKPIAVQWELTMHHLTQIYSLTILSENH